MGVRRLLLLSALFAAALSATIPIRNAQDKVLTYYATGNFACRVNSMSVVTENPGEKDSAVQPAHIRAAFQSLATLEWAHVTQSSFSALDGRNDEKVLGTPGGDLGEFIQAIASYGKVANRELTQEEVTGMLEKYLRTMTREKFSYETDEKSYTRLALATGCRNLKIADMGGMRRKKEDLLDQIDVPDHIGDPFIHFITANATDLDFDARYVKLGLTAFHRTLWNGPADLSSKLCYTEVKGPHREAALVNVKVPSYCVDQGLAPMVSQQMACANPVYVNFPDTVKLFRRELVACIAEGQDLPVEPRELLATYNQMAENNFASWWGAAGNGLPVYNVEFSMSGATDE